jgi:hypothetical protein
MGLLLNVQQLVDEVAENQLAVSRKAAAAVHRVS